MMSEQFQPPQHWSQVQPGQPSFMPPPAPTPQPGAVWLPPVANDRSRLRIIGILLVLAALLPGFREPSLYLASNLPTFVKLGMLLFALLFPAFLFTVGVKAFTMAQGWPAINQHRQMAAAYGALAGVPLAQAHPFPNIEAHPLLCRIKHKAHWFVSLVLFCLMATDLFCVQAETYLANGFSFQGPIGDWIADWLFLFLYPIGGLAGLLIWLSFPQSIEVTAQGLHVRHSLFDLLISSREVARKQLIPWEEARLFAIRDGKPGASTIRYELAGDKAVVTFGRIVRPRWWSLYRPAQPLDEYNAQMDALLAYISARTGLLLYDVR